MYQQCVYFNLSTLNRKITKIWQDEFNRLGLSPSHGYLLSAMAEKPMSTQKELSELMELDASTITRFIDVLNAKKLVEKVTVGKGATFSLTAEGLAVSAKSKELMTALFTRMQESMGANELTNFVDSLQQTKQVFADK
ncbi:MarR family transcriptional regulator [Alteromonas sp. 5E99-2]|uniref:MarR family winged helix-turn-helix transcriptional regulator n=1 Tax=Alteromonas sp. 5E99-2 TaxID=2817683 RepID=UPI001A98ACFC|nr:helix-turn-helix domain-containing protein [Alteromonas sp. 5E99-2]MBO1254697.1 MarR family transcriptional regulator [Alteromonas sp. 5E99-2]